MWRGQSVQWTQWARERVCKGLSVPDAADSLHNAGLGAVRDLAEAEAALSRPSPQLLQPIPDKGQSPTQINVQNIGTTCRIKSDFEDILLEIGVHVTYFLKKSQELAKSVCLEAKEHDREYLMIYKGPSFLALVWFSSLLTPSPSPLLPGSSTDDTQEDWERETSCWREREGGRGCARSPIIRPQESLILYKPFNTLWSTVFASLAPSLLHLQN